MAFSWRRRKSRKAAEPAQQPALPPAIVEEVVVLDEEAQLAIAESIGEAIPEISLQEKLADFPDPLSTEYDFAPDHLLRDPDCERGELRVLIADEDPVIAFNALFTELTALWRDKKYTEYQNLVFAEQDRFEQHPKFVGLKAQAYRRSTVQVELQTGLEYARQAIQTTPNSPKALHTFAGIVTSLADRKLADEQLLADAEEAVYQAIYLNPEYSWYQATLTRLLLHQERYDEAKDVINKAVEQINPQDADAEARENSYRTLYLEVQMSERIGQIYKTEKLNKSISEQIREDNKTFRAQVISWLAAILAAAVVITIGYEAQRHQSFTDAIGAIVVNTGSVLVIFAVFQLLFRDRDTTRDVRAVFAFLIGAAAIAAVLLS